MTGLIGYLGVALGLVSSVALVVVGFRGLRHSDRLPTSAVKGAVYGLAAGSAISFIALEVALLRDDFSIAYIANRSASVTPFLYKISSAWGALEGSIVLWGLVRAGFTLWVYLSVVRRGKPDPLGVGALAVMGVVSVFFFGLMATVANPFAPCIEPATVGCLETGTVPWAAGIASLEGWGPNPLLQNHFLVAVHPPTLYIGYVGLTVPFAFAISALILGTTGSAWLRRTRHWTLIAWMFLTIGIVVGGIWSYEVLGWGGFWAWDPVENASFMPWLIATAFLHSSVIQERRGMLQSWNFSLIITAFALTILGTFLTRSGVISSVHSFADSPVGPLLLWFLMFVLITSFGVFAARSPYIGSPKRLDSLVSREGIFLGNNLLLTLFAFVVLAGTLYPMVVEAITGDRVSVGRPFFDRLALPIVFVLLIAMAIGPITPMRVASAKILWERLRTPLRVALGVTAAIVLLGYRGAWLLLTVLVASFVIAVILRHLVVLARKAAVKQDSSTAAAALHLMRKDSRYWGGQIAHIGVAVLALGIGFSANLTIDEVLSLSLGETASVAGYEITYVERVVRAEPGRVVEGATLRIEKNGSVSSLEPRIIKFPQQTSPIATPSVAMGIRGDLYTTLNSLDVGSASIRVLWFPFIWLVWVGSLLTAFAALWSLLVRKPKRSVASPLEAGVGVGVDHVK